MRSIVCVCVVALSGALGCQASAPQAVTPEPSPEPARSAPEKATNASEPGAPSVCYTGSCEEPEQAAAMTPGTRNVRGGALVECGTDPMTGWFRDGHCRTDAADRGVHVVCASVTDDFLTYTASKGNDLSTPRGAFPGLAPGDRWCLCASRWREAMEDGHAPPVVLDATHEKALRFMPREVLERFAK